MEKELGMVVHACHPSYGGTYKNRIAVQTGLGKSETLPPKKKGQK
jgi:hypothetical protein